jgi:arginine-tRNA-protein transferase
MSNQFNTTEDGLRLFHTGEHPCGYWPQRTARDLVLDPRDARLPLFYPTTLGWGFRRSGDLVYRPHCLQCRACVAVRIPVEEFSADRSQRRCAARNVHIEGRIVAAELGDEHVALFHRYQQARHPGGGMDQHGAVEFRQFLIGTWPQGRFLELRDYGKQGNGKLVAVALTDVLPYAFSAVYTFYDPDYTANSLGTLAILRQIEWARREHRQHLYLGFWINGHRKMDYKRNFKPLEAFDGREWIPFEDL